MSFPLAERELTRSGRHWRTYALRVATTSVPCVVLIYSLPLALAGADAAEVGENVSRALSSLCKYFQYGIAFVVTPMMCARPVSRKRLLMISRAGAVSFSTWVIARASWRR